MTHNGVSPGNPNGVLRWADSNAGNIWNVNTIYANTPSNTSNTSAIAISGRDAGSNVSLITVGGASNASGLWVGSDSILFNNAPLGGGGTSISNDGSTVAIDATGNITINTSNSPNVADAFISITARDTVSQVGAGIKVGGNQTDAGLWVGSSNLYYNDAILSPYSISRAGATVLCGAVGSIVGTTATTLTTEEGRINFTTNSLTSTVAGSNPGDIGSINFNTNLGGSNTPGGNYGGNITYNVGSSCEGGFYPPQVLPTVSSSNVGVFQLGGTDVVMTHNGTYGDANGVITWADSNAGNIWNVNTIYANTPSNADNTSAIAISGRDSGSNVAQITVGGASTETGLWVGSSNVLFNNVPLVASSPTFFSANPINTDTTPATLGTFSLAPESEIQATVYTFQTVNNIGFGGFGQWCGSFTTNIAGTSNVIEAYGYQLFDTQTDGSNASNTYSSSAPSYFPSVITLIPGGITFPPCSAHIITPPNSNWDGSYYLTLLIRDPNTVGGSVGTANGSSIVNGSLLFTPTPNSTTTVMP
jgi:hypothetical protein